MWLAVTVVEVWQFGGYSGGVMVGGVSVGSSSCGR